MDQIWGEFINDITLEKLFCIKPIDVDQKTVFLVRNDFWDCVVV